jgi:hypothetical protein
LKARWHARTPNARAYLAEACGADAVLRARIDRLLGAGDRVETFLETPAVLMLEPRP